MSVGENTEGADHSAILPQSGPVAQLGARFHGMEEVVGSIPTRSTRSHKALLILRDQNLARGPHTGDLGFGPAASTGSLP